MSNSDRIYKQLSFIYGREKASKIFKKIKDICAKYTYRYPEIFSNRIPYKRALSEKDIVLITYGDQFKDKTTDIPPLRELKLFTDNYLCDVINGIHILPFYPYSSDDGFSVIDYFQVNPELGNWKDIQDLSSDYDLMFDAVINHISSQSKWFLAFKKNEYPFADYFITVDPSIDLSEVVRPRAKQLLTPVETNNGIKYVWTTFSEDQIDLNFANPTVLLEIINVLLFYVSKGARFIRLDAIAYLWKEIGTSCIHLPQTHAIVKLFRAILDEVAPDVLLITETNVPHEENISYFGQIIPETNMTDEAQLVYQFPLAPLVMHTFISEDITRLHAWLKNLNSPGPFFNFIASHDGIGILPAKGLLTDEEIQALIERTLSHGGLVSYRNNSDGTQSVYELNITLYDALNAPTAGDLDKKVDRFIASQAIMLSIAGIPGVYVHSLFGSQNCLDCVQSTGRPRSINRHKFYIPELQQQLTDESTRISKVFNNYIKLIQSRIEHPAFHPDGEQRVIDINRHIFSIIRKSPNEDEIILCLTNISDHHHEIVLNAVEYGLPKIKQLTDIISGQKWEANDLIVIQMKPYSTKWLLFS